MEEVHVTQEQLLKNQEKLGEHYVHQQEVDMYLKNGIQNKMVLEQK